MVKPIFVRGLSRSGGTLLVTLLDAHPDIAMSYELYPSLLIPERGNDFCWQSLLHELVSATNLKSVAREVKDKNIRTFILRCPRGGLTVGDLQALLQTHLEQGLGFKSGHDRLKFIESCCLFKMRQKRKDRWGLKCSNQLADYHSTWPDAYFLNIIRDGRDVLASQLNLGTFKKTPEQLGRSWSNTHLKFREFAAKSDVNALEVFYEQLVSNPEEEVNRICKFLEVPYSPSTLKFHQEKLDIYKTNHLSLKQISKPINVTKVGRWQSELTTHQIDAFYTTAKAALHEFGYLGA